LLAIPLCARNLLSSTFFNGAPLRTRNSITHTHMHTHARIHTHTHTSAGLQLAITTLSGCNLSRQNRPLELPLCARSPSTATNPFTRTCWQSLLNQLQPVTCSLILCQGSSCHLTHDCLNPRHPFLHSARFLKIQNPRHPISHGVRFLKIPNPQGFPASDPSKPNTHQVFQFPFVLVSSCLRPATLQT